MNRLSKIFIGIMLILCTTSACENKIDKNKNKNDNAKMTINQCIEQQKKALTNAGISLTGDAREFEKLAELGPDFYKTLSFCTE